ncbi:hypothetical protein POJ06DRAFT_111354 [Lipomyces tetrasporus]|uniref:Uncharacterized protein n=1 Tax=Lipomyces tetrasporus TaxID=54092 RepID=A0AAD7QSQ5_9ASCO|nr:uncharacterized protein POJ06DRAFT_111354 [Lipomyces tetrasporus]KAJ8100768.1 hypothetical protein POJ06DRAFT_111354 [Lipomyces tetrasporus]
MATTSATRPTSITARENDIERKIRLYGIVQAFKLGKMPTNNQIDVALNSFLATDFMNADSSLGRKLSGEGRTLLKDFAKVVENAKVLVLTKNYDNLFQEFVWHSSKLSTGEVEAELTTTSTGDNAEKDTATLYDRDIVKGLKDLGTLIITNGQFRKLLNDSVTLFRDMAADVGSSAAQKVRPSEDQLAHIDEPAAEDTWAEAPDYSKLRRAHEVLKKEDVDRDQVGQAREEISKAAEAKNQRVRRAKKYLSEKIPKDRRDQIMFRLKKMVVEIQGHPDYQTAIDCLLDLAETYKGHIGTTADKSRSQVKKLNENDHLQLAQSNLKILIERFANNTSLDDLFGIFDDLYVDADNDPVLKGWFRDLDSYIRKVLKQKGYIVSDIANQDFNRIYDRGNEIFSERYRDYGDQFKSEFGYLIEQFKADPLNKRFGDSVNSFFTDLRTDQNGEVAFNKHLSKDITEVILPELSETTRFVPLPRIEYTNPEIDVVVENLVIESGDFFPNLIDIQNHSFMRWGRKAFSKGGHASFVVKVSGIQCNLNDVSYYVHKKKGFPSIRDTGIADFLLGYEGLSFRMKLSTPASKERNAFFNVDDVKVKIKRLDVKLKKSNHKLLFSIFRPLLIAVAKPALKVVLQKQIREAFDQLDETSYKIHQDKKRIAADISNNPDVEKKPSSIEMYLHATRSELLRQKEKKVREKEIKGTKAEGKFNVAMTQDDTILKDIVLPSGFTSTKATMYKKMAAEGDRWMSEVFNIGTAAPSKNISAPPDISRRTREEAAQDVDVVNPPNDAAVRSTDRGKPFSASDSNATRSSGSEGAAAGVGTGAAAGATTASMLRSSGQSRHDRGHEVGMSMANESGGSGYDSGLDACGTSGRPKPTSTGIASDYNDYAGTGSTRAVPDASNTTEPGFTTGLPGAFEGQPSSHVTS